MYENLEWQIKTLLILKTFKTYHINCGPLGVHHVHCYKSALYIFHWLENNNISKLFQNWARRLDFCNCCSCELVISCDITETQTQIHKGFSSSLS